MNSGDQDLKLDGRLVMFRDGVIREHKEELNLNDIHLDKFIILR